MQIGHIFMYTLSDSTLFCVNRKKRLNCKQIGDFEFVSKPQASEKLQTCLTQNVLTSNSRSRSCKSFMRNIISKEDRILV